MDRFHDSGGATTRGTLRIALRPIRNKKTADNRMNLINKHSTLINLFRPVVPKMGSVEPLIIIMVIFKCYFSGEHIALSIKLKNNNKGVNIE